MNKKLLAVAFVAILILVSPMAAFAEMEVVKKASAELAKPQNNDFKQLKITRTGPLEADLYYDNAYDVFSLEYTPTDKSLPSSALCTVFTFTKGLWNVVKEDAAFNAKTYEPLKETENFVFVINSAKVNPYPPGTKDFDKFRQYLGETVNLFNLLKHDEVKASNSAIEGINMNYHIYMPLLENVAVLRTAIKSDETQKETINFIYMGKTVQTVAVLKIYSKSDWLVNKEPDELMTGKFVLDLMDYVFVLESKDNPYRDISIDAQGFNAAAEKIKKSVSEAFVYNLEGTNDSLKLPAGQDFANLFVKYNTITDKILPDSTGRPLFPMRALAQALGYKVDWDENTSIFVITKANRLMAMKKVKESYTMENYKEAEHFMCSIIGDRTYVDLDFVLNVLECELNYDGKDTITVRLR